MALMIKNNASSQLAASLTTTATALSVTPGHGARFPQPGGSDWFPLTLVKADGTLEIVRCTARNGDSLTVVRAQEGTAALAFAAGDRVSLRLTAGAMLDLPVNAANLQGVVPASALSGYYNIVSTGAYYATRLEYDYTINGVVFNGTGNITVADSTKLPLTGGSLSGNLEIRNQSPTIYFRDTDNPSAALHVNGNLLYFMLGGVDTAGWTLLPNGTYPVTLNLTNGELVCGGYGYFYGGVGQASDARLKHDDETLVDALQTVCALRGVRFKWNADGRTDIGFIAQELQPLLPELVTEREDGTLGVSYGNLTAVLVEAIKALNEQQSDIECRLRALEG
ncbi:MAG: hypothetical protein CMJ75_19170 [Planctomycetaceae bacterium]|nr:hypothetical protein [Planctomycetaceae bacterium]